MLRRGDGDTRLTSLRVSLDISLAALGVDSAAHRLYRLIALLPAGMAAGDCVAIARRRRADDAEKAAPPPSWRPRASPAAATTAGACSRRCARRCFDDYPPGGPDKARLVKCSCRAPRWARRIGTASWERCARERYRGSREFRRDDRRRGERRRASRRLGRGRIGLRNSTPIPVLLQSRPCVPLPPVFGKAGDVLGEANCI